MRRLQVVLLLISLLVVLAAVAADVGSTVIGEIISLVLVAIGAIVYTVFVLLELRSETARRLESQACDGITTEECGRQVLSDEPSSQQRDGHDPPARAA